MNISNILVVVDPSIEKQRSFDRAVSVAKVVGAKLHLFACISEHAEEGQSSEPQRDTKFRENRLKKSVATRLDQLAALAANDGIASSIEVVWNNDWYGAIAESVNSNSSDLVVKNFSPKSLMHRKFNETSDWTLMRNSDCPVLLVKNEKEWKSDNIVAAVETISTDEDHKRLTDVILSVGNTLLTDLKMNVHFVSAYEDSLRYPDRNLICNASNAPNQKVHILSLIHI